jgi:hypothetical protein
LEQHKKRFRDQCWWITHLQEFKPYNVYALNVDVNGTTYGKFHHTQNCLKLFHYIRIIGAKVHANCVIKIILGEIICSNICVDIIHHVFCMIDLSEIKNLALVGFLVIAFNARPIDC